MREIGSGLTASSGEIRPSGRTEVASIVTAPAPRVTQPYKTYKNQKRTRTYLGSGSDTYSGVNEMPVGRMAVIRAVLTHRSHEGPILEGEAPDD